MARRFTQLAPIHRGMPTENKQKRTPLITQKTYTTKDLEHDYLMEFRGSSPPCQEVKEKSGSSVAGPGEAGNALTHPRIDPFTQRPQRDSPQERKARPPPTATITDGTPEPPLYEKPQATKGTQITKSRSRIREKEQKVKEKSGSFVAGPGEAGNACTHPRIDASTHRPLRKNRPFESADFWSASHLLTFSLFVGLSNGSELHRLAMSSRVFSLSFYSHWC